MGSRGPIPKPPDKLLGHRKRQKPDDPPAAPARRPPARTDWLPATKRSWWTYWRSELAGITTTVDLPGVYRLWDMYDQHGRAMAVVRQALVVKGSTGQIRTNPLADHALKLEGAIGRLETELGLTPAARHRLGLHLPSLKAPAATPPAGTPDRYGHLRVVNG